MPFQVVENSANIFRMKILRGSGNPQSKLVYLSDTDLTPEKERVLENLGRIADETVIVIVPEELPDTAIPELMDSVSAQFLEKGENYVVVTGALSPYLISSYPSIVRAKKVVFIDPRFDARYASRMASFEIPCLVISPTAGQTDHSPHAVKYHDLISGSRIQYIRGTTGNPLFEKFTQSFNALQSFLTDE